MKEPIMIACPHCGKETPEAAACRNCGKNIESLQGLEVQYKDFKGTEMLDIKMASHGRHDTKKPAEKIELPSGNGPRSEKGKTGKKAVIFSLAAGVIILSALAWYYLLKLLSTF